jgi:tetratricopeptide (TPR) repeat protein
MPTRAPSLFVLLAGVYQRHGRADLVQHAWVSARQAGRQVGPKNLGETEQRDYFAAVRQLAEAAQSAGDLDAAIENYQLLTESVRSGLETLRTLAGLYEQKGDAFGGLRVIEQALLYDGKDRDLLERKDRYYYSIMPEELRRRADDVRSFFDVEYCLRKARALLDHKNAGADAIGWAKHLAELAQIINPGGLAAKLLRARALKREGDTESARAILEEIHDNKPESFRSGADEEAWFLACRLLGDLCLYELDKPEMAVRCFHEFRKSAKSGADTLFKLGQAYEQLGDRERAKKSYQHVTAYEGHPLAPDARQALYRLSSE